MISSSFFSAALAILAVNGVHAGPCRPTTVVITEASLTETTLTNKGEPTAAISTTELSVTVTETTADEDISTGTTTEISVTTTEVTTISEDVSSTETSAQDTTTMLIPTTMQTLQSTTTSALTTTTSAAVVGDPCLDNTDCYLAVNPVYALGLCTCTKGVCTPPAEDESCTLSSQCGAGQDCQKGICVDLVDCAAAENCVANLDLCVDMNSCACVNGVCRLL